jgi:hypothetical protein
MLSDVMLHLILGHEQFDAPEKFSKESKAMLKYGRQLGDIVIAPKYVLAQCGADLKAHEVSVSAAALLPPPYCAAPSPVWAAVVVRVHFNVLQ